MPAPESISRLTEQFREHLDAYKSCKYNETQLRREFLDPFFVELGWDVFNTQGYAGDYKDVVHEAAIKIGGTTKAPDYSFRIGGQRKFFVEAKKPSVDVKGDPHPAYQLRRYAWTAGLPVSILSDFEEFAVYDCRVKPSQGDKASTARILYMTFEEYEQRWGEIEGIFSKTAILKGAFDKYASKQTRKRGTAEPDDEFLKLLEGWRGALAQNISRKNTLSVRQINHAVQLIIDRIVFLRICEDRGVEVAGTLQGLLSGPKVYERLNDRFRLADAKYNSGLFHFHEEAGREAPDTLTPTLEVGDKVLKDIIRNLYYPESPYEFSVLPADILGHVYERFLGSVITLSTTGKTARVEKKPEVRKAGGVYYTPTYIVDYIVEHTVGELLKDRKLELKGRGKARGPVMNKPLRVLDPACGSGSFLLGAYQCLLDWHLAWYVAHDPQKWATIPRPPIAVPPAPDASRSRPDLAAAGDWKLTLPERRRILVEHIFGVDIDAQAVEVTKLSLLLKVLEGESDATLQTQQDFAHRHERALPDLSGNIRCGNSLIGNDFYQGQQGAMFDEEEQYRINAFDWDVAFREIMVSGGFDAVIGNPPYDVLEKERGAASWPHETLRAYVRNRSLYAPALGGKLNLFRFFIIRSLPLLNPSGWFGMIVPLALLGDISCASTRAQLIQSTCGTIADCFPQKDRRSRRVFRDAKISTVVVTASRCSHPQDTILVRTYPGKSFDEDHLSAKITLAEAGLLDPQNIPIPLVDEPDWVICRRVHSYEGVQRLEDVSDYRVTRGEINQTIYRKLISNNPNHSRLLKGVEIGRYHLKENLSQGSREWFDEVEFLRTNEVRQVVTGDRIAIQRITGIDERQRVVATLMSGPAFFADSTNSVVLQPPTQYDLRYLLGQLNSRLYQWRFKLTSTNNNVGTNELKSMPFRTVDFGTPAEAIQHDRIVELVQSMLDMNEHLHGESGQELTSHERRVLEGRIASTDREIDQLVYDLYGLTDEEIAIVEEAKTA